MNTNITITCETCEQDIDCRIGYSNRKIQPLNFACPHCESILLITLDISEAPETKFEFDGCQPSSVQPTKEKRFDGENPFIDLHLDFPVRQGAYKEGETPFLVAMQELTAACGGDANEAYARYKYLTIHLTALNDIADKTDEIQRLINLYFGKNRQLFMQRATAFLNKQMQQNNKFKHDFKEQDTVATLYSLIAAAFFPFTIFKNNESISREVPNILRSVNNDKLRELFDELQRTSFLTTIHRDCLRLYPRVLSFELQLRPVLFIDLLKSEQNKNTAIRVSYQDFSMLKDLYKDIIETMSSQLVLIAGINNLMKRGGAHEFAVIDGGKLSNLGKFSGKPLSNKFKYLDDCWLNIETGAYNLDLRNAIAHNNISYDAVTQIISYYPNGGGFEQVKEMRMSMIDFKCLLLKAFREMHDQNMVIKCLKFYQLLIHDRPS